MTLSEQIAALAKLAWVGGVHFQYVAPKGEDVGGFEAALPESCDRPIVGRGATPEAAIEALRLAWRATLLGRAEDAERRSADLLKYAAEHRKMAEGTEA